MLTRKGIGLEGFNTLSMRKAEYLLYQCCSSVSWCHSVALQRPYIDRTDLLDYAENELSAMSDQDMAGCSARTPAPAAPPCSRI
jgi:hypothetical protein